MDTLGVVTNNLFGIIAVKKDGAARGRLIIEQQLRLAAMILFQTAKFSALSAIKTQVLTEVIKSPKLASMSRLDPV